MANHGIGCRNGLRACNRDPAGLWPGRLDLVSGVRPIHARDRARAGRTRVAQDAIRVLLGPHVGWRGAARVRRAGRDNACARRRPGMVVAQPLRFALQAAALALAALLATPYSLDYDMMVLAPAIGFLVANGLAHGFAPYEKTALAALWLVPLIARVVAQATLIPLGPIAMGATFALLVGQASRECGASSQGSPLVTR